jgi:hypothetical protein
MNKEKLGIFFEESHQVVDTEGFDKKKKWTQEELHELWVKQGKVRYPSFIRGDDLLQCKAEFPKLKPIEITMISSILVNQTPEEMMKNVIERRESMQQQAEINAVKFIQEVQAWKEKWFGE